MYRKNITPAISLLVVMVILVTLLVAGDAQANTVSTSKDYHHYMPYVRSGSDPDVIRRDIGAGTVTVTHSVTKDGGDTLQIGDTRTFTYDASDFTFNHNDGLWDTPYGKWVTNLDQDRTGEDYHNTTYWQRIWDYIPWYGYTGNYAKIAWSGVKPTGVYMTSDTPGVVSCSGMVCTAHAAGTARVTAHIPETAVRIWSKIWFNNAENSYWGSERWINPGPLRQNYPNVTRQFPTLEFPHFNFTDYSGNRMKLPAKTTFWDLTVQNPAPDVQLFVSDNEVIQNDTVTLTWTTSNAASCSPSGGSGGWSSVITAAGGGSKTLTPTADATYTITCSNGAGMTDSDSKYIDWVKRLGVTLSTSGGPVQDIGSDVRWTAVPLGGQAPYTFTWTGDVQGLPTVGCGINKSCIDKFYDSTGQYSSSIKVEDNLGQVANETLELKIEDNRKPQ